MSELPFDAAELLNYLLPGFVSAWLFYGLTSHPKPSQFERVVQALILTFVVQVLVSPFGWLVLCVGDVYSIRPWDDAARKFSSLVIASFLGAFLAWCTNKDMFHRLLRRWGFTSRTSHPSEWFCAFTQTVTYVVLHLKDGRRLCGWPKEWPISPDSGQFYIQLPEWINEDGTTLPLPELDGILVQAKDVHWVEFLATSNEQVTDNDKRTQGIQPSAA